MTNILDYLDWLGDISFNEVKLNKIDALILSRLSYLRFKPVKNIRLFEAIDSYLARDDYKEIALASQDIELILRLRQSRRFKNLLIYDISDDFDSRIDKQFAAMTILINSKTAFISYRGTDDTLTGWKEDFNMAFMDEVPSQIEAVNYLDNIAAKSSYSFILGGHSKGGNLAVYAAVKSGTSYKRIKDVYNFDGPGFSFSLSSFEKYNKLKGRFHTYIPQSSIIGLLMDHEDEYTIVKSTQIGLMQHDIYSWLIKGREYILSDELTKDSVVLEKALHEWLRNTDKEKREQFVEAIFTLLKQPDENKTSLFSRIYDNISYITSSIKNLSTEERRVIVDSLSSLIKTIARSYSGENSGQTD